MDNLFSIALAGVGVDYTLNDYGLANAFPRLRIGAIQQRLPTLGSVLLKAEAVLRTSRSAP